VAEERVAVERDLCVERPHLALGCHDQRVDLRQRGVLRGPHLVQRHQRVRHAIDHVRVDPAGHRDARGLLARQARQRVDVLAHELLGMALRDLLDVHAAFAREHHQRLLRRAVEQHRRVILAGDVRGPLDPQRVHDVTANVHPQDVARVLAYLRLAAGQLDPARLAAAADQHLGL